MINIITTKNEQEKLHIEIMHLKQIIEKLESENNALKEMILLSRNKRFGASSEKNILPNQISLFDNIPLSENQNFGEKIEDELVVEEISYKRKKRKGYNKDLPIEIVEYKLTDEEKVCECCNGELHEMSTDVAEELLIVPAQVKILKKIKYIYSCRNCEKENIKVPIKTARAPKTPLPGSPASSSAIAYIMAQKFVESMPLYRLEKHFERMGILISRQTMSNWMIKTCEKWLSMVYEHMKKKLLKLNILHCDETTLQVLNEPGKTPQSKSYMWLYRSGKYDVPIVLYEYKSSREAKCPKIFLEGYSGYIHSDGYKGYNKIENIIISGCWSHVRRKYTDALKSLPANIDKESIFLTLTHQGIAYCNKLFEVERLIKDEPLEVRFIERIKKSKPILDEFRKWLEYNKLRVLPSSNLMKAINYTLGLWDKLVVFLYDARLEIDNNRAERSIKPFVIARKNFLFCNTPKGADAAATIISITETAKENNLNPFEYLKFLFDKMPNTEDLNENELDKLMPWSKELPQICKVSKSK